MRHTLFLRTDFITGLAWVKKPVEKNRFLLPVFIVFFQMKFEKNRHFPVFFKNFDESATFHPKCLKNL